MSYVESLVTKGILGDLPTKGITIVEIKEIPIRAPNRGYGPYSPNDPGIDKKIIKVTFIYKGNTYRNIKVVDKKEKIDINNINVEFLDGRPTIQFKIKK